MSNASDTQEEAYILEKKEISIDDDEEFEYNSVKDDADEIEQEINWIDEDDNDLEDFDKLKAKTTFKQQMKTGELTDTSMLKQDVKPKVVKREIVIDDYIRNFLRKFNLMKSLNVFQQEWNDLHKKGVFHDNQLGLITDTENKN
jgi:hypothetical protein